MTPFVEVQETVALLVAKYGSSVPFGRSRLFKLGSSLSCSINYSKLLRGGKYFFGLSIDVVSSEIEFPETEHGDFVLLVCGGASRVLVLPRQVVVRMMEGVETRRVDVFVEEGRYILQTTRHPKLDVTRYMNAYPASPDVEQTEHTAEVAVPVSRPTRDHVSIQWALIRLGQAAGHSVWVPPGDRGLSHEATPFAAHTLSRLPHLGFDEGTRRVVQNIDVLWMNHGVILKAFEIESTTTIYSGLLRLNDLVLGQPNNRVDLYIAAGDERREQVANQLMRPSFRALLPRCEFLGFNHIQRQFRTLSEMGGEPDLRISGLLRGERFQMPDHVAYPLDLGSEG
jgi:hypothetical protein